MSQNSIAAFDQELIEKNQLFQPFEWSSKQNHLASKLVFTDAFSIEDDILTEARDSLEAINQEESPQEWAEKCNALGDAYHAKSQQESASGVKYLNSALDSYMKVLKVWTRKDNPSEWASTFNNLGMVFMSLGERTKGMRALEKSIAAFKNSLTYRTVEEFPKEWAVCQNNLGVALRILAELSKDVQMLDESVKSYENALEVVTPDLSPVGWVTTKSNLGDTRLMQSMQLNDIEIAREATKDFGLVVDYFHNARLVNQLTIARKHQASAQAILQQIAG